MEEKVELTPQEYFDMLKAKKETVTDQDLLNIYDNCMEMLNKYKVTGQKKGMKKLIFHVETIEKEIEIVRMGINTFLYKDDIEEYIDSITNDTVKIIELENYEREIPDEIVEIIAKTKDKFTQMYVLFTDYTGKVERQVEKERRDKDPILFGTFQDKESQTIIDRFYFLGDWEDEFCDLTLDKMVNQIKEVKKKNVVRTISTPKDIEELKSQLNALEPRHGKDDDFLIREKDTARTFSFKNIRTFFGL